MGKSFFAGAVAGYVNRKRRCSFFCVSASDLMSVWQSESEKSLIELFKRTEQEECSIVFLDEVKGYIIS
jgi:SpoVK/Ycf46/Vps4 family AAA+-type ATPase